MLRSSTKGYGGKTQRLTHKTAIQLHLVACRELCQLHFSLQAASAETFGYTVVYNKLMCR